MLSADNKWFNPSVGLIFDKFGNFSVYYIWNIQTLKYSLVSFLKYFETSLFDFETL